MLTDGATPAILLMRMTEAVIFVYVLAGWLMSAVLAQPAERPRERPIAGDRPAARGGTARGSRGLPIVAAQMISQGDKDGDNQLTKDEFTNLADAWFTKLDSAGTDKLTEADLTSHLSTLLPANSGASAAQDNRGRPQGGDNPSATVSYETLGPILFSASDVNKDGALNRVEFKQTFATWFDLWDSSKGGKLNLDALRKGLEI